jgi:hypothetical protein
VIPALSVLNDAALVDSKLKPTIRFELGLRKTPTTTVICNEPWLFEIVPVNPCSATDVMPAGFELTDPV